MLYQILDALHYIHLSNVIHRDLKPANILVSCADTRIKVADFGLSRVVEADLTSQHHVALTSPDRGLPTHRRTMQPAEEAEVRVAGEGADYEQGEGQGDLLDGADEAGRAAEEASLAAMDDAAAGSGAGSGSGSGNNWPPSLTSPAQPSTKVQRTAPAAVGSGSEVPAASKAAAIPRVPLTRSLTKHVVGRPQLP